MTKAAYVPLAVAPAPVVAVMPPAPPRTEKYTPSAIELSAFNQASLQGMPPKLDEVGAALRGSSAVQNVVITGYTDRIGSGSYNQKLPGRRANSVKTFLIGKGIDGNRLSAQGRGEDNPIVMCQDKKLPALVKYLEPNRRVEVEKLTVERRLP